MINNFKIVSYFTYFDETCQELLILHINVLKDVVDEFIICESNKTQSGVPIEYKLKQRIEEFELPKEKIKVIELDIPDDENLDVLPIDYINSEGGNHVNLNSVRARTRERMQRDALLSVVDDYNENTFFIVGDCDEIVKPEYIQMLLYNAQQNLNCSVHVPLVYLQGRADLRTYGRDGSTIKWDTALYVCFKSHLRKATPLQIRSKVNCPFNVVWVTFDGKVVQDMGWHFSWMGPKEKRLAKRDAFCHYQDVFAFNNGNSYSSDEVTKNIIAEPVDGVPAYSSSEYHILKNYPHEKLPNEIFENKRLSDYFVPNYKKPNYSVGDNWQARIHVVDNFYADPYAVRELALRQQYVENGSRGVRSLDQFIFPGVKEAFEKVLGKKITRWADEYGICGRFQYCTSEDALVYHCDAQRWAAMIFLTPNAPHECGTSLLKHKKTGIRTNEDPNIEQCFVDLGEPYFLDPTPFEEVDVIGNVFNRLVLFDGRCIHSARKYFGNRINNSRLFQIFFFDAEE